MTDINNLIEFAENGEKDITGLNQTNGFPAALKPARQWFNYLFNSLSVKINEVIERVNNNSTTLEGITDYFLPIGTIISSFDADFNPNTKYPGTTWILHGEGRVGVGLSTQVGDPEWKKTIGNIFGSDTHPLITSELPPHNHSEAPFNKFAAKAEDIGSGNCTAVDYDYTPSEMVTANITPSDWIAATEKTVGDGVAHNNVQPSIVEARWRRTA